MSNRPSAPRTTDRPAQPAPTYRPVSTTDRPTATFPTGWQARPSGYLPEGPATAARLARADATPTGVFPTNRSARPRARYHTPQTDRQSVEPERAAEQPSTDQESIQDMGRPGPLSKPSMRWHPSLMQLAIGAALVAALLGACNVAAINAHRTARAYCHALVTQDWDRAQRECRGTGQGTPMPERAGTSPQTEQAPSRTEQAAPMSGQTPTAQPDARPGIQPEWVTHDSGAPYDRTDPSASPLLLPACTTSPTTPMPCLAHVSADSRHAVVLEEDGSMTGLDRQ